MMKTPTEPGFYVVETIDPFNNTIKTVVKIVGIYDDKIVGYFPGENRVLRIKNNKILSFYGSTPIKFLRKVKI